MFSEEKLRELGLFSYHMGLRDELQNEIPCAQKLRARQIHK